MINGLLPHVPLNVWTVKGVEIVPVLTQKRWGAQNGRGEAVHSPPASGKAVQAGLSEWSREWRFYQRR